MIKGKKYVRISAELILSKISEYDIFRFYMPNNGWKLGQATYSPFRDEKNPSFLIGVRGDTIMFIDFGDTSMKGDCFEFVKKLYNIPTFNEVLIKIDNDFNLGISSGSDSKEYKKIIKSYSQPEMVAKDYSLFK